MTDVFVSYAPEDRDAARTLAQELERGGLDVGWEWAGLSGDDAVEAAEQALTRARCVLALWSEATPAAGWVEPEARAGLADGRLLVGHLGGKLPRRLRRAAAVDLTGWDGTRSAPEARSLVTQVAARVAGRPEPEPDVPAPAAGSELDLPELMAASRGVLRGHEGEVYDLAWSADGLWLATASADATARVWDTATGRSVAVLGGHPDEVNDVAVHRAGDAAVTGCDDGSLRWWSVGKARLERATDLGGGAIYSVDFTADGGRVAAATAEGTLVVFGGNGREKWRTEHEAGISACRFLPDGTVVATGDDDGRVVLWDAASGDRLLTIDAHDDEVTTLAVSPSGRALAASSEAGGLTVWEVPGSKMRWWQSEPAGMIYGSAFSAGGDVLAASDDEGITFWRADDGEPLGQIEDAGSTRLEFTPHGGGLAWASGDAVQTLRS